MNVTVFGASRTKIESRDYKDAYRLGKLLAESGHAILTGGYIGTMEAVSRGANEAGGHVIGVTCTEIERWRAIGANPWVKEERKFETLQQRINGLIDGCDAAIALPGGPGTLAEIATMWNMMIVNSIATKPLILTGSGWQAALEAAFFEMGDYFADSQRMLVSFTATIESAVKLINHQS